VGEGSASRPGRTLPPGKTRCSFYRRLGGPQGRSREVRKISPPPGFDPRTVQLVMQSLYRLHYPAHIYILYNLTIGLGHFHVNISQSNFCMIGSFAVQTRFTLKYAVQILCLLFSLFIHLFRWHTSVQLSNKLCVCEEKIVGLLFFPQRDYNIKTISEFFDTSCMTWLKTMDLLTD
jgi:hypothetical protein